MRLDRLKRLTNVQLVLLGLTMASVPAWAFQESKIAPAEQPAPAPQLQAPDTGKPGIQLTTPESDSKGTEVRIPGLGKLGVLPKLDFGLDILYGATEDRRQPPGVQGPSDEVTVRGSIKHKF